MINVPHGFVAHTGSWLTFAKPPPKPPHSGAKWPTLALYSTKQDAILFRVYFYYLLARTRVMPSLFALCTPSLRWFTYFSAHLLLWLLPISSRPKILESSQRSTILNCEGPLCLNPLSFVRFTSRSGLICCSKLCDLLLRQH